MRPLEPILGSKPEKSENFSKSIFDSLSRFGALKSRFEASRADFGVKTRKKLKFFKIDFFDFLSRFGALKSRFEASRADFGVKTRKK